MLFNGIELIVWNKSIHLWFIDFWQWRQDVIRAKEKSFQQMLLWQLSACKKKKKEFILLHHTRNKSYHNIDLNIGTKIIILRGKHKSEYLWPGVRQWFLQYSSKNTYDKEKNEISWTTSRWTILCCKQYYKENKDPQMGENVWKSYICLGVNILNI